MPRRYGDERLAVRPPRPLTIPHYDFVRSLGAHPARPGRDDFVRTRLAQLVGGMVASTLDAIEDDLADYVTSEERERIAALASGLFSVERPAFFSRLD